MVKIVVIEDAKDLREDVVEMLELEGYDVSGAEDGLSGVEQVNAVRPDLIVCDIMMPGLTGYEVLEEVRKNPKTATIPFIFLTARTERVNVRHGMVLGADDYLTKPFLVTELLDSIHSQLKKRKELNEAANERMDELRENIITALPHELRTPLNTMLGFSDMLMMEAQRLKPDQIADWAGHINLAAHRLYRLVENYLYYVRLQVAVQTNQQINPTGETVTELRNMVETEALRITQQAERESDLELDLEQSPELQLTFQDVNKIVTELLDNALKFSEPGQRIFIRGHITDTGAYQLCVQDEGRGMTAEQAANIGAYMQFERWLYEQQGMGLGLAIIKLLMELHGGEFSIDSEIDVGTTACVILKQVG